MPILGIENLTENWMTARTFAPLFEDPALRRQFVEENLGTSINDGDDVSLELFWRGLRDYGKQQGWEEKDYIEPCTGAYERLFSKLRTHVSKFGPFKQLAPHSYGLSDKAGLASLVRRTEIDIVLEAPNHLLIGEAKYRSPFSARGEDVLVHQLIRQYVTAQILLDLKGCEKQIVPFVVGEDKKQLCRIGQVRFMIDHFGMRCENVLEWKDIPQPTG